MEKAQLVLIGLLIFLIQSVSADVIATSSFPKFSGTVVDSANLLSISAEKKIIALLSKHKSTTTNQVVVVTVPSLETKQGDLTIEQYGLGLAREWELGEKGKDNGLLFLVAQRDKKIRIEVGYGLEGTMTDAIASSIIRHHVLPNFKRGRFNRGILEGSQQIIEVLSGEASESHEKKKIKTELLSRLETFFLGPLLVFPFVLFGWLHNYRVDYLNRERLRWRNKYLKIPYLRNSDGSWYSGNDLIFRGRADKERRQLEAKIDDWNNRGEPGSWRDEGVFSGGGGGFGGAGASGGW